MTTWPIEWAKGCALPPPGVGKMWARSQREQYSGMEKPLTWGSGEGPGVELAGAYSKQSGLLDRYADLRKQVEVHSPRQATQTLRPRSSGGPKKHLAAEEATAIVTEYEAGASMAQLKGEHHMAKRTVAKVLREAGVTIRPRGGQYR